MDENDKKQILAEIHKGVPDARVEFEDILHIRLDQEGDNPPEDTDEGVRERLNISLDSIRVDIHNQSYGMISASTGCISNPGGPSC